jgi:26S proteasome regulatory subunit N13
MGSFKLQSSCAIVEFSKLFVSSSSTLPNLSLSDILTPAILNPLFISHPELVPALFPHLPPDLPVPPSVDVLERIIASPQFRSSVATFDQALRTGLLGNLVRGLGLPEEAGTGIEPFLRAVQAQADQENQGSNTESMETD